MFPEAQFGTIGTVGGGCLDASVIRLMKNRAAGEGRGFGMPFTESFTLDDELGETAMTCGGKVEVLFESLTPEMLPLFEQIESQLRGGDDCVLVTRIDRGGEDSPDGGSGDSGGTESSDGTGKYLIVPAGGRSGMDHVGQPPFGIADSVTLPGPRDTITRFQSGTDTYLLEYLEAPPSLFIFGGGHVGRAVAEFAVTAGFRATVVDDRSEFADAARFPAGTRIVCRRFDLIWEDLRITDGTFVVIVTRGHKHDEMILERCLRYQPRYLGMIGSRRKVQLTFRELQERGVTPEQLSSVQAPIGLKIGALTPEEIGVSIVAEMIAVRRSRHSP
jgi:xanthine dehydrogenase accessory factor